MVNPAVIGRHRFFAFFGFIDVLVNSPTELQDEVLNLDMFVPAIIVG